MPKTNNRVMFTRRLPAELIVRLEKLVGKLSPQIRDTTHALEIAIEDFIKKNTPSNHD